MVRKAKIAKKKKEKELLEKSGVVGVGVGAGSREVVHVYVKKKTPRVKRAVPQTIDQVPTKIVEAGSEFRPVPILARPEKAAKKSRTDKWRPAPGGVSIGHYRITAGTLGSVVLDKVTGKKLILSNNHVLANSDSKQSKRASKGDPIYQPGAYDGGTEDDQIGTLERWKKLDEEGRNRMDAALAKPSRQDIVSKKILEVGAVRTIKPAKKGTPVRKSGRTSAVTFGEIKDVDASIKVNYGPFVALFVDQIITGRMLDSGDSGSLLVDRYSKEGIGLGFASSAKLSAHNKLTNVAEELGIAFKKAPPGVPKPGLMTASTPFILGTFVFGMGRLARR